MQCRPLPAAVERYFAFALPPGQRRVVSARFVQRGVMRTDAGAAWKTFRAIETFTTRSIGYSWRASLRLGPFVSLAICDGYADGKGSSDAKIAGLLSVGHLSATPEVNAASLVRYLAEAPWLPTALLPSGGVAWTSLGPGLARGTLVDGGTTVWIDAEFATTGELLRSSTMRYRAVGRGTTLTPWTGTYSRYARRGGMMIPLAAEVSWGSPAGDVACWRGEITEASYRFD